MRIAALFVETGGVYFGDPEIDPWDIERDARDYDGAYPVIAHPPCSRWCRLAGLVEARWGHKRGEDGGCFESALASVRRAGGVLEHPAYSDAWKAFDITKPPRTGGWASADGRGGFTCHVEQGQYGHPARKATWLYAHNTILPALRWGCVPDSKVQAWVSWCGNRTHGKIRPRLSNKAASVTPPAFRDVLMAMARSVPPHDLDT